MTATIIRKPGDWVKPKAGYLLAVLSELPRKARECQNMPVQQSS